MLAPGLCGPESVMGLWMPSVDRAGRLYPLTIAAIAGHASVAAMTATGATFLTEAARAGLDALEHEWQPDALAARVGGGIRAEGAAVEAAADLRGASLWWTDGSPLVPASAFALPDLPGENLFARMLDARDTDMVA
jgi:type VI secretion system protein ImpM